MKISTDDRWIAFAGGAWKYTDEQVLAGYQIGQEVARRGFGLITGATKGIPYAAGLGTQSCGQQVVGISPASSYAEHVASGRPISGHDCIVYTGLGADGRSPLILRSAPAAIFVGGEMGTLLEFCSGWITGERILGLLTSVGGMSSVIPTLLSHVSSDWQTELILGSDPAELARKVCEAVDAKSQSKEGSEKLEKSSSDLEAIRKLVGEA